MKKIIAAVVIVVIIGLYIFYRMSSSTVAPAATTGAPTESDMGNMNMGTSSSGSTPPPTATTSAASAYKDGTYTGSVADAFYGKVQVKATILNGKITDVAFLQYPTDGGHTLQVSQESMPVLTKEAITIQSANVDIISGATQTSQAFQQSLESALAQAQA